MLKSVALALLSYAVSTSAQVPFSPTSAEIGSATESLPQSQPLAPQTSVTDVALPYASMPTNTEGNTSVPVTPTVDPEENPIQTPSVRAVIPMTDSYFAPGSLVAAEPTYVPMPEGTGITRRIYVPPADAPVGMNLELPQAPRPAYLAPQMLPEATPGSTPPEVDPGSPDTTLTPEVNITTPTSTEGTTSVPTVEHTESTSISTPTVETVPLPLETSSRESSSLSQDNNNPMIEDLSRLNDSKIPTVSQTKNFDSVPPTSAEGTILGETITPSNASESVFPEAIENSQIESTMVFESNINTALDPLASTLQANTTFPEVASDAVKIAFLMPEKNSPLMPYAQTVLQGFMAKNFSTKNPARVLLVHPDATNDVQAQLNAAALSGAALAVGPIERNKVQAMSTLSYLPLPVLTLNQTETTRAIALTESEIEANRKRLAQQREAQEMAEAFSHAQTFIEGNIATGTNSESDEKTDDSFGRIATKSTVPGLISAREIEVPRVRYEPIQMPEGMLMFGLSMADDATYLAQLVAGSLPEKTESGQTPKILVIDIDRPNEQRLSQSIQDELIRLGHAPDKLTIDLKDLSRINKLFQFEVEKLSKEEFDEPLIKRSEDPVGYARQQLRIKYLLNQKRTRVAISEPPYHSIILVMNVETASQVRSRLPLRSQVWGLPMINPGDLTASANARARAYDLRNVTFIESPFVLNFNAQTVEQIYRVPAPRDITRQRLFAQGVDAWSLAQQLLMMQQQGSVTGLTGTLSYNLQESPIVVRHGQPVRIQRNAFKLERHLQPLTEPKTVTLPMNMPPILLTNEAQTLTTQPSEADGQLTGPYQTKSTTAP